MTRLILATFLLFGFQSKTPSPTIEIISVDMDIMTRFGIDCAKFDQAFENEKKFKTLKRQKQVDNLLSELKNLEAISKMFNHN